MGKTPKPLAITVTDPTLLEWEEFIALVAQGHFVQMIELTPGNLVIGPNCCRMDEVLRPFFPLAIKEARARAYPSKAQQTVSRWGKK